MGDIDEIGERKKAYQGVQGVHGVEFGV